MKSIFPVSLTLVLAAALMVSSCGDEDHAAGGGEPEHVRAPVYSVQLEEFPLLTTAMGTIEPYEKAQLSTRMMGYVRGIEVEEGDRVEKGQLLVRLDNRDIESKIEQARSGLEAARSQLENAEAYYERIRKLHEEQSATRQALDNARTQYESARAQVAAAESRVSEARAQLSYTNITAPFGGYIADKRVQLGDMGSPGMPLVTVEMQDSMKIVTSVSEKDVGSIRVGDEAWVETDVPSIGRRKARVETVVRSGDPRTRRFTVKLVLPNSDGALNSGVFARVLFRTGETRTIAVPDTAVVERGQLTGLFVLDENNRTRLRWVQLGRSSAGRVEVLSGLSAGERIAAGGLRLMREGQVVEEVSR